MRHKKEQALPEKVQLFLQQHHMVQAGDTVCCALSGGADSVCLLRCLLELAEPLQLQVTAIHVNHQLRGAESERDAAFCSALCTQLQVPLQMIRCDVTAYAERQHCSIETAARDCRYAAFESVVAVHVATAHTASDNLETMLHRVIRGSGLRGLAGIPPVRGRYIRPLLTVTRTEVEAFLQTLGQDYVTDSTNATDAYTRNRIRHDLIPKMQQLNPALEQTAIGMLQALQTEQDYMAKKAAAVLQVHQTDAHTLSDLQTEHPAMQLRCIMQMLEQFRIPYDAARLHRLQEMLSTGGNYNLTDRYFAHCENGCISIIEHRKPDLTLTPQVLHWGKNQLFSGFLVEATLIRLEKNRNPLIVHKKLSKILLDYDKIKGVILLRGRQYGDHVRFAGHASESSVKKEIQKRVPPQRRQTLHFLADEEGTIFAEFLGVAARVQPDAETTRLLQISIQEIENHCRKSVFACDQKERQIYLPKRME
ncbi:MAG: tRNA lysidine(34) synthetase TilS [Oscillospiraceae bacterium]|nr:tRNA lysidine(34) synthetase TilS [Oscillospiraceae bacterium]